MEIDLDLVHIQIYHALPCSKKNFKWLTCGLRNCSHIPITLKKQYSRPHYPQVGICSSGTWGHRGLTVLSSCNLDDSLKIECSLYTAKVESKSNLRHSNPPIFHLKTNPKMTGILSGALWLSAALSEVLLTQLWVRRGRGRAWQIPCPHTAKHHRWLKTKYPVIGFDHSHLPATLAKRVKMAVCIPRLKRNKTTTKQLTIR